MWQCEHWTRGGLLIHFLIVTSLPKSTALHCKRVLVTVLSGSEKVNVMEV